MILYDTHKWRTLLQVRGSIIPRATLYAMPATLMACALKVLTIYGYMDISELGLGVAGKSNSIYSGASFVLGFVLVLRASQSYERYWLAATSVLRMQAEWLRACSTLVSFCKVSKAKSEEVCRFVHTTIRLVALLHAMALSEISTMERDTFPLLDIQGFDKEELSILLEERTLGRRVQVVFQWIQGHIIKGVDSGVLNAPPPLLTRVLQDFGVGFIQFNSAQQVVIWPFPFACAQLNSSLVFVHTLITPVVVCEIAPTLWVCLGLTFVSVSCMIGLELIAIELENPFGDDPNDLPVLEMQQLFIKDLTMMTDPQVWHIPVLQQTARLNYWTITNDEGANISLEEYCGCENMPNRYFSGRSVGCRSSASSRRGSRGSVRQSSRNTVQKFGSEASEGTKLKRALSKSEKWFRSASQSERASVNSMDPGDVMDCNTECPTNSVIIQDSDSIAVGREQSTFGIFDEADAPMSPPPPGPPPPASLRELQDTIRDMVQQLQVMVEMQRQGITGGKDSQFQERVLKLLENVRSGGASSEQLPKKHSSSRCGTPSESVTGAFWQCQTVSHRALSPTKNGTSYGHSRSASPDKLDKR